MSEIIKDIKTKTPIPWQLTREGLLRFGAKDCYGTFSQDVVGREWVRGIVRTLGSDELKMLVGEGRITLAMIKPQTRENLQGVSEFNAFLHILHEIRSPLKPIFEVSIWFSPDDVEEFYAGQPKESQLKDSAIHGNFPNRWEEFKNYMTSGPSTFLLLHSDPGGASQKWRKQVGSWDVVGLPRDTETIRGKWAKDNYTSIVHGSDNPSAILREIEFLRNHLARFL